MGVQNYALTQKSILITAAILKFSENSEVTVFLVAGLKMSVYECVWQSFFQVYLLAVIKKIPPGYTTCPHAEKEWV